MKLDKKVKAVALRKRGMSITKIAEQLDVSKGSVSTWVREVVLTDETLQKIKKRSHSAAAIERRRQSRLVRENKKKNEVIQTAFDSVKNLSFNELFVLGVALYWGEGTKKKKGVVEFTNSDPRMIEVMKIFFEKVCNVPSGKFRGHVYIHEHLNKSAAERYWSEISSIPQKQFHKTSIQHNKKKHKKDSLPHGTFAIVICDTKLKLTIEGWTEGVYRKAITL